MKLYNYKNYAIFYESNTKMFVCYKNNGVHKLLPYKKHIETNYQLQDDARDWFEQWIKPKFETSLIN